MPMRQRAPRAFQYHLQTTTDTMLSAHIQLAVIAVAAAALLHPAAAHDLAGIDTERRLEQAVPRASESTVRTTIAPALAHRVRRALDQEQAYQILFTARGSQPSYAARLVNSGAIPFSIFEKYRKWDVGTTLKACFYSAGAIPTKEQIAQIANQWSKYGAIYFDFGTAPNFNFCQANDGALVRISFRQKGYWSLIGTQALASDARNVVTMGLQDLDKELYPLYGEKFKSIVIHEFGHAIGLAHEHQHPAMDCYAQFDVSVIERDYGWTHDDAVANLARLQLSSVAADGKFYKTGMGPAGEIYEYSGVPDPDSVMRYDLRKEDFLQPPGSCYIPTLNAEPSKGDQAAVARVYARDNAAKSAQVQNALIEKLIKTDSNFSTLERAALRAYKH